MGRLRRSKRRRAACGHVYPNDHLAAKGLGLDTCPQAAWIPYQEPVLRHLGMPADQALVTGMSVGYADHGKVENTLESEREAVRNVVTWRGWD